MCANPETTEAPERIVLEHLSRVVVEPGDVLVFKAPEDLTLEAHKLIRDAFRGMFPDNELVIINHDAELSVLKVGAE